MGFRVWGSGFGVKICRLPTPNPKPQTPNPAQAAFRDDPGPPLHSAECSVAAVLAFGGVTGLGVVIGLGLRVFGLLSV